MVQVSAKKKQKKHKRTVKLAKMEFSFPRNFILNPSPSATVFFYMNYDRTFLNVKKSGFCISRKKDKDKVIIKSEISLVGSIEEEGSTALSNTRRG